VSYDVAVLLDYVAKNTRVASVRARMEETRRHQGHLNAIFFKPTHPDPKTVQTLLRHSDVKLTLQCYTHSVSEDRMAAAGAMLAAIFSHAADRNGLKAD
jgi:integrase